MTVQELYDMTTENGLNPAEVTISIMGVDVRYTKFHGDMVILDECEIEEEE